MKTGVRLVDGSRELVLHPSLDYVPQRLTVGSPAMREVTEDRTDDDGERDTTTLFGGRAVSLELVVVDERASTEVLLDQVKRFLHPRSRPYLHVTDDGWGGERRIRLRVDQWDEPYEGYAASHSRPVQFQWKAPDGVWEAAASTSVTVSADISQAVGLSFPVTFPVAFTATQAAGAAMVDSPGSVPSHFTARLYGPCVGPRLVNQTTGEEITFVDSLSLAAGDYIEVNTRDRTAYLTVNGSASQVSRLNSVDFTVTSWWRLEPGTQVVRYAPPLADAGAAAVIDYRACWL